MKRMWMFFLIRSERISRKDTATFGDMEIIDTCCDAPKEHYKDTVDHKLNQ